MSPRAGIRATCFPSWNASRILCLRSSFLLSWAKIVFSFLMVPLFKATSDFLNREYPGNTFMTAHFDHSIATAIWRLDGQADNLLDTYHREIAAKGLQTEKMVPALRFSTSDVGMSGANLYPIFLVGAESRIVPLGYSIRTEHKNGVDMQYFEEQLRLVYNKPCQRGLCVSWDKLSRECRPCSAVS